jgi:hypothetical protein
MRKNNKKRMLQVCEPRQEEKGGRDVERIVPLAAESAPPAVEFANPFSSLYEPLSQLLARGF